jgi:hypothetical protein
MRFIVLGIVFWYSFNVFEKEMQKWQISEKYLRMK